MESIRPVCWTRRLTIVVSSSSIIDLSGTVDVDYWSLFLDGLTSDSIPPYSDNVTSNIRF